MKNSLSFRNAVGVLVLALGVSAHAVVTTVNAVDPNPNGDTIVNAASNSLAGGISLADFQSMIATSFTAGRGGTLDAETANGLPTTAQTSVDLTVGNSSSTMSLARTDVGTGLGFDSGNDAGNAVSGTQYIGMVGTGNATFTFGKGLSAFGLTMIPRGAVRTSQLVLTLDNGTTYSTSVESIDTSKTARFFGALAPTGRSFVSVSMVETGGLVRYDDLGFVVAPQAVPEPSAVAALALGGLALLRRRHR